MRSCVTKASVYCLVSLALLTSVAIADPGVKAPVPESPATVHSAESQYVSPRKNKVVIFYSSIGQGHLSAAKSIQAEIMSKDPQARVELKNIRDFMPPLKNRLDEKLYYFVFKNLPNVFDRAFQSFVDKGRKAASLSDLPIDYPEEKVLEYLKKENPGSVIASHYGAAQVLGNLREKGELQDVKIGWIHTDFFDGYFPRISKRIDKTFLAHPALADRWIEAGVNPHAVDVTGMPVSLNGNSSSDRAEFLSSRGLDPEVKTVTLAAGRDGAVDFSTIVKSISDEVHQPIQVVVVCGLNSDETKRLEKLSKTLPQNVRLKVLGFIPQAEVVGYVQNSDVFINKAGGLSSAEAFTIGKPTILFKVLGGHENENATFFRKAGLAEYSEDLTQVGAKLKRLLSDSEEQARMVKAQAVFKESLDVPKIADFALNPEQKPRKLPSNFGLEGGVSASGISEALSKLEADSPADIELLLSYSSTVRDKYVDSTENPFGHIAIRIGNTVYSANHHSKTGDMKLFHDPDLKEYLFGVHTDADYVVQHTASYGMSFGRDTLGLRIRGLSAGAVQNMKDEAEKIQEEFRQGLCRWTAKNSNCADFTSRILRAGGIDPDQVGGRKRKVTMPLDVFDKVLRKLDAEPSLGMELIAYNRLPGSQNPYRFSRFPLSIYQMGRSLKHLMFSSAPDPIENKITKRIVGYPGDDRVHYENAQPRNPQAQCLKEGLSKLLLAPN